MLEYKKIEHEKANESRNLPDMRDKLKPVVLDKDRIDNPGKC